MKKARNRLPKLADVDPAAPPADGPVGNDGGGGGGGGMLMARTLGRVRPARERPAACGQRSVRRGLLEQANSVARVGFHHAAGTEAMNFVETAEPGVFGMAVEPHDGGVAAASVL